MASIIVGTGSETARGQRATASGGPAHFLPGGAGPPLPGPRSAGGALGTVRTGFGVASGLLGPQPTNAVAGTARSTIRAIRIRRDTRASEDWTGVETTARGGEPPRAEGRGSIQRER